MTVDVADLPADSFLYFTWQSADGATGADLFAPQPFKSYPLTSAGISRKENGNALTLTASGLGLFVAVEADCAGRWDRNAVTLLPDTPVTFTFTPNDPAAAPRFTVRDLHSATHA